MRRSILFVIGSGLIIISALMLIADSAMETSSAYTQQIKLYNKYNFLDAKDIFKNPNNLKQDYDNITYNKQANDCPEQSYRESIEEIEKIILDIPYGLNGSDISGVLKNKKLIKDKNKFIKLLLKLDIDRKMKAGKYIFNTRSTVVDVLLSIIAK